MPLLSAVNQQTQAASQQSPSTDIRQYYSQGLASVLSSEQFVSMGESSQRNMIGTFIFPFVNLILKQSAG